MIGPDGQDLLLVTEKDASDMKASFDKAFETKPQNNSFSFAKSALSLFSGGSPRVATSGSEWDHKAL